MSRKHPLDGLGDAEARRYLGAALELAGEAGRCIQEQLRLRGDSERGLEFKGRRELVTAADKASEELLVRGFQDRFPGTAILAEEGVLTPRGKADREAELCWVIDPIDGTTNFVHGHPFYSISIGLLREGRPWLGVVHAPALGGEQGGAFYYGGTGIGAFRDGKAIHVSATTRLRDAVVGTGFSYNRNEEGVNTNLGNFGKALMEARGIRRNGSAALDLALTAEGVVDAFWELYLSPYDVAAGIALVLGAGGTIQDLGSGEDPLHGSEILASNGVLDQEMREMLEGIPRQA